MNNFSWENPCNFVGSAGKCEDCVSQIKKKLDEKDFFKKWKKLQKEISRSAERKEK